MRKFTASDLAKSTATRKRMAKRRRETVHEWFWDHVTKTANCWLWNGSHSAAGYGRLSMERKWYYAHRVAWEISNGPIPDGLLVCHSCDNPGCVRPDHLFLGTDADNIHDMISKGRAANGPRPRGDEHWTRIYPDRVRRGRANGKAKLTPNKVREIRTAYRNGASQTSLSREYGVKQSTIWQVLAGKTWKHVTGGKSCL